MNMTYIDRLTPMMLPTLAIEYSADFMEKDQAQRLCQELQHTLHWQQEAITVFGKTHLSPRLIAYYADPQCYYHYAGQLHCPRPWPPTLLQLRQHVTQQTGHSFNSALANYYRNGNDTMGWHSDNELELGDNPIIASVSLGADRPFKFRHRHSQAVHEILLGSGSLLLMGKDVQRDWQHSLPRRKRIATARINITFRYIYTDNGNTII